MDSLHLVQIAGRLASQRILVVGDLMLDEFLWGKVSRISPEAPVPVVDVTSESYYPGGAANVARNVREFTTSVGIMGIAGTDSHGHRLLELLAEGGIDTAAVQRDPARSTTVKTRVIARNQQVVRVDRERKTPLTPSQTRLAIDRLERCIPDLDGIVVADYGKGFLSQALADALCAMAKQYGKILTVDPHPHTSLQWHGATAIKPNRAEAFLAAGLTAADPERIDAVIEVGRRLLEKWGTHSLLITLGEQGMMLFESGREPYHTPTRAKAVFDVSGAGDTAIALLTLGLCAGATPREAAELANRASGIVVGKLGTATVTLAELQASLADMSLRRAVFFDRDGTLMEDAHYCSDPALVRVYPEVSEALRKLKAAGFATVVITNQSGIGRGTVTEAEYRAVQEEFLRQVGPGLIDASYFCPDPPGVPSICRKPEPGMVVQAAVDLGLDPAQSWLVGDKSADIECGQRVGARTILVLTGYGAEQNCQPDFVAADAVEAVALICGAGDSPARQP